MVAFAALNAPGELTAWQGPIVSGWLAGTAILLAHIGTATLLQAAGVAVLAGDGTGTARLAPSLADAAVAR